MSKTAEAVIEQKNNIKEEPNISLSKEADQHYLEQCGRCQAIWQDNGQGCLKVSETEVRCAGCGAGYTLSPVLVYRLTAKPFSRPYLKKLTSVYLASLGLS